MGMELMGNEIIRNLINGERFFIGMELMGEVCHWNRINAKGIY